MISRWWVRRLKALGTKDDGAILILAIAIVTTVALVVGLVLTRGDGSLRATLALRNVNGTAYAADSAANVAINGLRTGQGFTSPNKFDNALGTSGLATADKGCFGNAITDYGTDNLSLNGFYRATATGPQSSAYIECTGEKDTGAQGSPVQVSSSNKPGQAILTLDTTNSDGLDFGHSSETNTVHGSVTSDSGLQVKNNSSLNVTGTGASINANSAKGGCNHVVQVNGVNTPCGTTAIPDPGLSSPHNSAYDPPSTLPALPTAPTCPTANNGPEIFYPGVYTVTPDQIGVIAEVQTITITKGTTTGTFTPSFGGVSGGAQAYNVTPAALQTALSAQWGITVTVTGSVVTATTAGTYAVTFPTILGDVSTMTMASAGLGSGKSATVAVTTAGSNQCQKTVGWYYFAPQSASNTGIYYFNWSGSWNLGGTAVGGTLSTNNDGTKGSSPSIAPAGNASAPTQPGACVNPIKDAGAVGVELVFGGTAQFHPSNTSLKEFCATYSSSLIPTVVYGLKSSIGTAPAPVVPAQSTCVASSSCAMITINNGDHAVIYFQGFVYAPRAYITLDVNNATQPFFNFGLIVNTLHLGQTGSGCGTCAYINLPDDSPGFGTKSTIVLIKVHVCLGAATVAASCKTNTPALIARVQLWDINGDKSKRQVNILSWSHSN